MMMMMMMLVMMIRYCSVNSNEVIFVIVRKSIKLAASENEEKMDDVLNRNDNDDFDGK